MKGSPNLAAEQAANLAAEQRAAYPRLVFHRLRYYSSFREVFALESGDYRRSCCCWLWWLIRAVVVGACGSPDICVYGQQHLLSSAFPFQLRDM